MDKFLFPSLTEHSIKQTYSKKLNCRYATVLIIFGFLPSFESCIEQTDMFDAFAAGLFLGG